MPGLARAGCDNTRLSLTAHAEGTALARAWAPGTEPGAFPVSYTQAALAPREELCRIPGKDPGMRQSGRVSCA